MNSHILFLVGILYASTDSSLDSFNHHTYGVVLRKLAG